MLKEILAIQILESERRVKMMDQRIKKSHNHLFTSGDYSTPVPQHFNSIFLLSIGEWL